MHISWTDKVKLMGRYYNEQSLVYNVVEKHPLVVEVESLAPSSKKYHTWT